MFPRPRSLGWALLFVMCFTIANAQAADPPLDKPYVPGEVIIKFKNNVTIVDREMLLEEMNASQLKSLNRIRSDLKRIEGLTVAEAISRYKNHPKIEFIEPNYILEADETPNDPRYPELWGMNNTGQTGGTAGADISAEMAWDVFTGSDQVIIGVIDTGVDYLHPDLAANIWTNPGEIPGNGIDDDNNGFVDDIHGWDFYNNDSDPMDDNGHGTHCSGTIGGIGNNGVGVAGVNWNVKIMALKFLSAGGSGSTADAVECIEYATMMGATLTSNSWGGGGFSEALRQAIEDAGNAGQLFVAAAGNSSSNTDISPHYPSAYDLDNIVAVAATDHNDQLASFSSYGATTVDLAAPGVDILSSVPGSSYGTASGTSMATPHVAGVLGLIHGRFPAISGADAKNLLLNGVDPLPNLSGVVLTGGRLNAFWPIAEPDSIPPGQITDLTPNQAGSNWVDLSWTAVGDDGMDGTASRYDLRYATFPIDDANWDTATRFMAAPDPGPSGTPETARVTGLDFDTTYYFGVKALDEFGNAGDASNSASATTLGIPDIASSPTSMSDALLTGENSMQTLTLSNVGFGTLDFEIPTPQLLGEAQQINTWQEVIKNWTDDREGTPVLESFGGPDAFGYRWVDSNEPGGPVFAWADISGSGNAVITSGDDVSAGPFAIGFDFPYYGGNYPEFYVCSNGYVSLTSNAAQYSNQPLPSGGAPPHLIAPFWDDLTVNAGSIYYYNDGARLIVQWDAVDHYNGGGPYTFQALLYPDGTIEYQYLDMGAPLDEATVGWQNGGRTDGYNVAFNTPYLENNLAVRIRAVPQWLTVTPTEGTIWAPGSMALDVNFDATGLLGGTYEGIIRVVSNDPDEPDYEVPVTLEVTGAPDIAVEPASYDFGGLFLGATASTEVLIRNIGTDVLTVSNISIDDPVFTADLGSVVLPPLAAQVVNVEFTPTLAQFYSATMTIESDDPGDPVMYVALSGTGLEPPEFSVSPNSLVSNLFTGESESQFLSLSNAGGSDFVYDLQVEFVAQVTVHDSPDLGKEDVDIRAAIPAIEGSGGPDLYGYRWIDSDEPGGPVYNWVDISATGTPVTASTGDDRNWGPFPIGFSFPFYGDDFTEFRVCSNGWVSFTSTSTDLSNDPLPASGAPENLLAMFWDDLVVDLSIGGNVYYEYDGARLIIQYDNVRRYGSGGPYTFQAILYPNGTIVYQYADMQGTRLDEATIGIQNGAKDDGLTVVYNADYVHDGLAVRLAAFPEWLVVNPTAGTVPPGGSQDVTAFFDASGLFGGTYEANIIINSNDPAVPTLPVPVTLNVTGAPQIELSTTAIDFGSQFVGYPTLRNLVISNVGTDQLVISGWSLNNPAYSTNLTVPEFLGPTQQLLVDMSFLPASAGDFDGIFTIASNDPIQPNVMVDLTGVGLIPPVASASPTSLNSALFTGETETQTVMLSNSGGSDLNFDLGAQLNAESVVIHESPDLGKDEPDTRPGILGSGGPDVFGYSWIDSDEPGGPTFDWVDISATGTPVTASTGDDRNWGPFPIGFSFPFYGDDFTEFRVCSNGWVSFTSTSTDLSNDPLPATGAPENLLAMFWDDLVVDLSIGGNVYYEYDGARLIIQYDNVRRYGSGGPYTFQAILYPNGAIMYQYLDMQGTRLDEATIGIQNGAKDDGLTVVYNADYVHDGLAVRLGTIPDWISTNPTSGVVPPGGSIPIAVTFDASGLFGGAYDGAVLINSNDPMNGLIEIACHLDVTGIPLIAVDPASLDFGSVYLSLSETLELIVSNPGTQTLHVTGMSIGDADFSADPMVFDIDPLQAQSVMVSFAPTTDGPHATDLMIESDADSSPTAVPLTGEGVIPPQMACSPTEIEGAAMPGWSKTKTLQICNEGGSDLIFDLTSSENNGTSVEQYLGIAELPKETEDTRPGILGSGGPDAFGYTWTDSDEPGGPAYNWVDISAVGTPLFNGYSDDGNRGPVPIGFSFPFYGQSFDELRVCSNGWLSFTSTITRYTNEPLPNASAPENLVAVFWDDMVVDPTDGGEVYYYNDGSRLIVQFELRRIAAFNPPFYSVQAILYPNGDIVCQYEGLGTNITSCTIGIQNATQDDGLTVVYNDDYVHEGLAVKFSAAPKWLSMSPESGVIAPGECMDITVLMDATSMPVGDHHGTITIASNDLEEPTFAVPVLFHVGTIDATDASVDPSTLNLDSNGRFVTAYVELPLMYDPTEVMIETVLLNGVVPAELQPFSASEDFNENGIPDLMFKFDRSAVEAILPEGEMVEVTITGEIMDTTYFVATDMIRTMRPHMTSPNGGEVWTAGASHPISWENPVDTPVDYADVYFSVDGGTNWYEVAKGVPGTSCIWDSPVSLTEEALIRVFVYDDQGLLGYDTTDAPFTMRSIVTGVDEPTKPKSFALGQNWPNPFNPKTTISFDLPRDEKVVIAIYDVRGSLVRTLLSEQRTAGRHEVIWSGDDNSGHRVSSGVYYYRILAGSFQATKRMVLVK